MRGSKYYVYHSTNRYNKEIKKGRKVSKYLGKLDKEKGFIPKGQNKRAVASPRNITEYGNADKLYLQDNESVFGHVFIAFLSLYIHCKLEQLLKKAELNHKFNKFTPIDLLLQSVF
ncbi:MAG: hypothetical protein H0M93_03270 [Methanophagales archaeon]|nr:hypothetical protein [Methanophagales archaeon]